MGVGKGLVPFDDWRERREEVGWVGWEVYGSGAITVVDDDRRLGSIIEDDLLVGYIDFLYGTGKCRLQNDVLLEDTVPGRFRLYRTRRLLGDLRIVDVGDRIGNGLPAARASPEALLDLDAARSVGSQPVNDV